MLWLDFVGDWTRIMRRQLDDLGYETSESDTYDEVCHRYVNVGRRRVSVQPRPVHRSRELRVPPDRAQAVARIERYARRGEDLTPHLSRRLLSAEFTDALLDDWGIHHFHLGLVLDASHFVSGADPLLFARVTDSDFFIIDVRDHAAFADQDLLEILHSNWPDTLAGYRMNVQRLEADVDPEERKALRRDGIAAPVRLRDGTVYFPPGGGCTTSGISMQVVVTCDAYRQRLRQFENVLRERETDLRSRGWREGAPLPDPATFSLRIVGNDASAVEEETGLRVRLGALAVRRSG
jgi:hypothetical protein